MLYDILAVTVTIALLALTIYLIPMVKELKKTAISVRRFFDNTEENLGPLIKELKETASQANRISTGAREGVDKMLNFMEIIEDTGKTIKSINSVVRNTGNTLLITLTALGFGIRKGLIVFLKGFLKGGDKDGR